MNRLMIFAFSLLLSGGLAAQGFSGNIEFKYYTQKDTSLNVYIVKNQAVKLDQYARRDNKTVEGSFLFDLDAGEVKFLNPKRRLWGRQESKTPQTFAGECVVTRGSGVKTIAGYKCKEVVVKNSTENTAVTYWIAEENFNFFAPLLKLWNRKDKQSIYFAQITDLKPGSMPLMSEEKQIDTGKTLTRLEVIKITKKQLPDDVFMVPKDYSKVD